MEAHEYSFGMNADIQQWGFSGISTFAHLNHVKCLTKPDTLFDIAILGVPFDTAVSYRPGTSSKHISSVNFSINYISPHTFLSNSDIDISKEHDSVLEL